MASYRSEALDRLLKVILALETPEECTAFFEDICTIKELQDMSQRLEVALLLEQGLNYQEISARTTVSTATISRVSKCLNYGSGGYRAAIERLKAAEEEA